jgi:hypothetical protein
MMTHLIGDLNTFGILDNDYDKFFDERAKLLSRELSKRIIKQEVDRKGQANLVDDFDEELTTVE